MRMREAKRRDIILQTKRTRIVRAALAVCWPWRCACYLHCTRRRLPPQRAGDSRVRVLLSRLQIEDEMHIRVDGVYAAGEGDLLTFPRGAEVSVTLRDGQLILHYEGMTVNLGGQVAFTRHAAQEGEENGMRLQGGSNLYEGDLLLTASQGVIRPVLTIDVEDYLLGVVPYEMSDSFPIEALKAQAVAARTYVLRKIGSSGDYDVVDTTNDQVFRGMNPAYPNAIAAVEQTAGVCGYYNGRLAECYYSASNGGRPSWSKRLERRGRLRLHRHGRRSIRPGKSAERRARLQHSQGRPGGRGWARRCTN